MKPELPGLCSLIQDTLPFYLEGDVSARSRQFVEQHLEECERCASFLAGGRSVQAHFRRDKASRSVVMVRDRPGQDLVAEGQRRVLRLVSLCIGAVVLMLVIAFIGTGVMRSTSAPAFGTTEGQPATMELIPTVAPPTSTPISPDVAPAP
jgi:predicted anti-sigma-YlaC factor YlaD